MARVPVVTDEQAAADPVLEHLFEGSQRLLGRMPNSLRTYAHFPAAAAVLMPLSVMLQRDGAGGVVDARTKQLVVLVTSITNECEYCVTHNTVLAEATGLPVETIDAITDGRTGTEDLSPQDQAVVAWARAVTLNTAARDRQAYDTLGEFFDDREIVELTWLSALFNMANRVHEALQIDVDPKDVVHRLRTRTEVSDVVDYLWQLGEILVAANPVDRVVEP